MPVWLALADVSEVHFHDREADCPDAVGYGNRGVCIGSGIEDDSKILAVSFL